MSENTINKVPLKRALANAKIYRSKLDEATVSGIGANTKSDSGERNPDLPNPMDDAELERADKWLEENGLNMYGDPIGE